MAQVSSITRQLLSSRQTVEIESEVRPTQKFSGTSQQKYRAAEDAEVVLSPGSANLLRPWTTSQIVI